MIKTILRLILMVRFITFSPKTRFILKVSLKKISSFLLWIVKYEDRGKWIIGKASWMQTQILKLS